MKEEKEAERILVMYLMDTDILLRTVAKQCALIHVQGIIDALPEANNVYKDFQLKENTINYWQRVKTITENK